MGERSVHRWDRRGSNLRCSIFNANVTVLILCFCFVGCRLRVPCFFQNFRKKMSMTLMGQVFGATES